MSPFDDDQLGFGPWAMFWFLGLLLLLFGSLLASQSEGWVGASGVGILIFLSSAMVGALLGFIFAVPRVIARDGGTDTQAPGDAKERLLSTNTNLERISDWLTTMLVGVGLSQLTNVDNLFFQFRMFLTQAATVYKVNGQPPSAGILPAIGPFILVLGIASGFLLMYLLTRLVLVGFFRHSEEMLGGVAVAAIRVAVTQAQADRPQAIQGQATLGPVELKEDEIDEPEESDSADVNLAQSQAESPAIDTTLVRASQATSISSDDALEVMFALLYRAGGYRRVIQMSGELSHSPIAKRAEYWFYLAAAFGQQMHHATNDDERLSARDNVLDSARRAVRIDRSFRDRLWQISAPGSTDNDLALLRDDSEFRKLVGRN